MNIYHDLRKGHKAILEIKNILDTWNPVNKERLENQTPNLRSFHMSATIAAMAIE